MNWTPWIAIEPYDTDNETVRHLYDNTQNLVTGLPPDTVRLNSLTPSVAELLHNLNYAIQKSAKGLTAREREIAALVVSSHNG